MDAFLAVARCASWDAQAADRHGAIRDALRGSEGGTIGAHDVLIAAHAHPDPSARAGDTGPG